MSEAHPAVQPKTDDFFFSLPVTLTYTNWRGETTQRTIVPRRVWFGSTDWHPRRQWLLTALDTEKGEERDFALKDFGNQAVQPKVKPLVWYGKPADFYMFADTAFGLYEIGVEHGDEWFSDFTDHKSGKPVRLSSWQDGSIAPQAAAQADYEARILSALEPDVQPDAVAIREEASTTPERKTAMIYEPIIEYTRAAIIRTIASGRPLFFDPDQCADIASSYGKRGDLFSAHYAVLASIRARGQWLLINGKWHDRTPYMAKRIE